MKFLNSLAKLTGRSIFQRDRLQTQENGTAHVVKSVVRVLEVLGLFDRLQREASVDEIAKVSGLSLAMGIDGWSREMRARQREYITLLHSAIDHHLPAHVRPAGQGTS